MRANDRARERDARESSRHADGADGGAFAHLAIDARDRTGEGAEDARGGGDDGDDARGDEVFGTESRDRAWTVVTRAVDDAAGERWNGAGAIPAPSPTGTRCTWAARGRRCLIISTPRRWWRRLGWRIRIRRGRRGERGEHDRGQRIGLGRGPDVGGSCGPYRQKQLAEIFKGWPGGSGEQTRVPCFCTDEELEAMKAEQEAKKLAKVRGEVGDGERGRGEGNDG